MANSIRKVSSANDLTKHMLEVIYSQMKYKQGGSAIGMGMGNFDAPQMMQSNFGGAALNNAEGGGGGGNELAETILDFMRNNVRDTSTGIHRDEIIKELSGRYSGNDIINAMAEMTNDGMVYSTIDDCHFCFC